MFLDDGRVTGSDRCEVVADGCVGDDEVEAGESLGLNRGDGVGGVGLGLVVDFHNEELAGGVFGEGRKLLRFPVAGVADGGDDGGGGAGEVGLDEAEADAWVLLVNGEVEGD